MKNPLSSQYDETNYQQLFEKEVNGDKAASNELIVLHDPFIYNVAWKFTNDRDEASDRTQVFLI
jgi:DNA-directed RNA polymerase specialized sigma subunit